MPHDIALDAELELQSVMTIPLLLDGLTVATPCFPVISTNVVATLIRKQSSTCLFLRDLLPRLAILTVQSQC